jgi:hypothetical protein
MSDDREATRLYKLAADQGFARAQCNLGTPAIEKRASFGGDFLVAEIDIRRRLAPAFRAARAHQRRIQIEDTDVFTWVIRRRDKGEETLAEIGRSYGDWPQLQRVRLDDFEADIMSIEKDGSCNPATWIDEGEKYALVGLSAKVEEYIPFQKLTSSLWVLADTTFNIPPYWREWLGSIRADEVQNSNLFLLSKLPSSSPDLDETRS